MSELAIIDSDAFERMEDVAKLHLQNLSPYAIARRLNIKVVEAKASIEQWREIVREDMDSRDAARDLLNDMIERYSVLIRKANENLEDLSTLEYDEKVSAQINTTLKTIGDLDAKRVSLMQQAGILDNNHLGDELAEREEREAMLIGILQNDLCPACKIVVRDKLSQATGVVQGTVVDDV